MGSCVSNALVSKQNLDYTPQNSVRVLQSPRNNEIPNFPKLESYVSKYELDRSVRIRHFQPASRNHPSSN